MRFFTGLLIDFALELVGLFAVEPPRLAAALWLDHAQAFKEQHTARVLLTDLDNRPCSLVGAVLVLTTQMVPDLLIASLSLHRPAGLPLLLRYPFEMAISVLVKSLIRDKAGLDDRAMLPHRDDGELLHIEIDGDGDQIRITFAFHDLLRGDRLRLQEVDGRPLLVQNQFGTLRFPSFFGSSALEIAIVAHRIVNPRPLGARVDLEADKALAQIQGVKIQSIGAIVEGRMIARRWNSWFAFRFASCVPFRERRQIASRLAKAIFDDGATIAIGETGKPLAEVPLWERVWMLSRDNRSKLSPGQQLVCGDQSFLDFPGLLGNHLHLLQYLVRMGQKKGQIEHACCIEDLDRLFEGAAFVAIGSHLLSCGEIKQEFGRSRSLSHQFLLLLLSSSL